MLTNEQKEAIVIEMLNERRPIREIAKTAQKSFSDIGEIKRRILGESVQYKKKKKLSIVAQALQLFSRNKTPIEVSIELDIDPMQVEKIYLNYLGLKGLHQLVNIHQEIGNYLPDIISFYWSFIEYGADNKKIKEILDIANRAPELKFEIQRLQGQRKNLEIQIEQKHKKIQDLDHQIEDATNIFDTQYSNIENFRNEVNKLKIDLENLKQLKKDSQNDDEYHNMRMKIEDMIAEIIDDKSINLPLICVSVLEAFRNDPTKYNIIFNYLDTFKNDNVNGEDLQIKENYVFCNNMTLLQEIDKITKKLLAIYSNKVISDLIGPAYS